MQPVTYSELMSDNDAPRQSCERGESAVKAARPISGQTSAPFEGYIKVSRVNVRWVEFRLKKKRRGSRWEAAVMKKRRDLESGTVVSFR